MTEEENVTPESIDDFSDDEEVSQEFLEHVEKVLSGEAKAEDFNDEEKSEPELIVGLTPMGTIGIRVSDEDGNSVHYFISDPEEAWALAGHIGSIATIMVQTRYAMAMQEQRQIEEMMKKQDLWMPGHGKIS